MEKLNLYKQHKILILQGTKTQNEYVEIDDIYSRVNSFTKILLKLHQHLPIPFKESWYSNWKNKIKNYDVIIIFDALRGRDVIQYIHKINPAARIIIYYVNKFRQGAKNDPENFKDLPCELWSFDKNDCERVQMRHSSFCYDDVFADEENKKCFYNKEGLVRKYMMLFLLELIKNAWARW